MASEDIERLAVLIEANTKSYENAIKKLQADTERAFRASRKSVDMLDGRLKALSGTATRLAAVLGVGLSVRGLQRLADTSIRVNNSLRVAGLTGEELTKVYDQLFQSAQKNAAPLEALTDLYGRAALVQKELGVSTEELLNFTDKVAVALRVSGKSAQESSGALLQLSQALGSGVVRAEEFNSLLEGALPIAQAAAAGLTEAGGSVVKLRQLVIDGKVSSEAFFKAFEAGAVTLDTKVAGAQFTVAQGFVQLQNALIDAVGKIDRIAGASLGAASGLQALANGISALVSDEPRLRRYVELAERLALAFIGFRTGRFLGPLGGGAGAAIGFMGPEIISQFIGSGSPALKDQAHVDRVRAAIEAQGAPASVRGAMFADLNQRAAGLGGSGGSPGSSTVSLADFASPQGDKATKKQIDKYNDLTFALENQLRQLTMNDREQAIANELAKLGAEATEEQKGAIAALTGKLYDQKTALEASRTAAQFFAESFGQYLSDLIPKIETGNSALDSLLNTMLQVAAQALLLGQGPLAGIFGTASGTTGVVGGLLGSVFGGFRASGGPVTAGKAYVVGERGPEIMVPGASGRVVPNGGVQQVAITLTLADDINARIDRRAAGVSVQVTKVSTSAQQRQRELNG